MEMETFWRSAAKVLGAAALMGLLSDLLLREGPWGLNAALWSAAFAMLLWQLSRDPGTEMPPGRRWCIPLIAVFGALLAWRDAPVLKLLDILAMFALCATLILRPAVDSVLKSGFGHYLTACVDGGVGIVLGLPSMLTLDVPKQVREVRAGIDASQTQALTRLVLSTFGGVAIAIPLILVFGSLFTSADTAFRDWVNDLFRLDWQTLFEHLLVAGFSAWTVAGFLHVAILKRRVAWSPEAAYQGARLDTLTILIPLGALIVLFGAFIAVQTSYFFGGAATVQAETGPSYAEYARQGFFQLVTVAALALGVLLLADWFGRDASPRGRHMLHAFTVTLVALVFVVMASALHRMALYTSVYGLTTLRFYTTAFMFWLAMVLLWFLAVILRGQRERFLFPAVASACACVLVFNAINPERIIVDVNTSRAKAVDEFDIEYLLTLSNDATPALAELTGRLPEFERSLLRGPLEQRIGLGASSKHWSYRRLDKGGWRAWSWSRECARRAVEDLSPTRGSAF
ncbi:MAG: DUF4173 domain-containing protein [Candidatus Hydrogenedentales bacterium]|jgi:hypothetical protein